MKLYPDKKLASTQLNSGHRKRISPPNNGQQTPISPNPNSHLPQYRHQVVLSLNIHLLSNNPRPYEVTITSALSHQSGFGLKSSTLKIYNQIVQLSRLGTITSHGDETHVDKKESNFIDRNLCMHLYSNKNLPCPDVSVTVRIRE